MVSLLVCCQHLVPYTLNYAGFFFFFLFSTRSQVTMTITLVLLLTLSNLADLTCLSVSLT